MNNALINTARINSARINSARVSGVGTPSSRSDKPTLDPALKAKLACVCRTMGKTNSDSDRNTIKDLTGHGNDFEILNAAYKLNSGYGVWKEDFSDSTWSKLLGVNIAVTKITLNSKKDWSKGGWVTYKPSGNKINSFKVRIDGIPVNGQLNFSGIKLINGINIIPEYTTTSATGFIVNSIGQDWSSLVIEQIPEHQGAFCSDGVDDVIVSKKTVREIVGVSNKITVISIIHQITGRSAGEAYTNYIRGSSSDYIRNKAVSVGKTGIYGYTIDVSLGTKSVINNLLGDKNDYTLQTYNSSLNGKLSIIGSSSGAETTQAATYGWIIAKDGITTDEIIQIITTYNLDWWIEPDAWCDIAKQGITNENHATFKDQLIDFSGNERYMQGNNFGWSGNSGVGKWATDFNYWTKTNGVTSTQNIASIIKVINKVTFIVSTVRMPILKVKVKITGLEKTISDKLASYIRIYDNVNTNKSIFITKDGIHDINYIPNEGATSIFVYLSPLGGEPGVERPLNEPVIIEQLPDIEGGLWHDGIDDNCISIDKFPAYKDFTAILDRQIINVGPGCTVSKNGTSGAFMIDYLNGDYSFGGRSTAVGTSERKVRYVTKYTNSEGTIVPGTNIDQEYNISTGVIRRSDTRFAEFGLYGLLVYPYSMNPFLIERQLKKRKFGTLYPKT